MIDEYGVQHPIQMRITDALKELAASSEDEKFKNIKARYDSRLKANRECGGMYEGATQLQKNKLVALLTKKEIYAIGLTAGLQQQITTYKCGHKISMWITPNNNIDKYSKSDSDCDECEYAKH